MNCQMFRKAITYLVISVIGAVGLIHAWRPITLSPNDSGDRVGLTFILLFLAWALYSGYRYARITAGFVFAFCGAVNLLILLSYFNRMESGNLLELIFWTTVLLTVGVVLLIWKGIRIFEEERQKKTV